MKLPVPGHQGRVVPWIRVPAFDSVPASTWRPLPGADRQFYALEAHPTFWGINPGMAILSGWVVQEGTGKGHLQEHGLGADAERDRDAFLRTHGMGADDPGPAVRR